MIACGLCCAAVRQLHFEAAAEHGMCAALIQSYARCCVPSDVQAGGTIVERLLNMARGGLLLR